jgi:hypothetical protein
MRTTAREETMDKQHLLQRLEDFSNQQKKQHSNQTASDKSSADGLPEKTEEEKGAFDRLLKNMQKSYLPFV